MKINLVKFKKTIKKNPEFIFLISTAIVAMIIMQSFNFIKEDKKKKII